MVANSLRIVTASLLASSAASEAGHVHGAGADFEWAGIFAVPENGYLWTAQKVDVSGTVKYVDASMKMAILPAAAASDAELHKLEAEGKEGLGKTCVDVQAGGVMTPGLDKCYRLVFKQDWWQSLYTIDTTGVANVAFFTEHVPTEFENTAHYLKDDHGDDIEPVAELPEAPAEAKKEEESYWGVGIGASILVNLVTLAGVVFMIPGLSAAAKNYAQEFDCLTAAFAAGAISACAFFLLLFESTHLIAVDHKEEVQQIWRWGTMILTGAMFPLLAHVAMEFISKKPAADAAPPPTDAEKGAEGVVATNGSDTAEATKPLVVDRAGQARLISSVLIGDFMHNLCDGFFIGAAFKGCGTSFGWSVAVGTIAHELAQELSDYVVLTGDICQLKPVVALLLNFLSGTSVLLGAIIVLATEVGDGDIGLLLAFGGGTYMYIAFVHCMPRLQSAKVTPLVRAVGVLMFILGATAIGLVLLDHEHCVPDSGEGGGGGHAHGGH